MSNGVEVIVRGNRTAYFGNGKTEILPATANEFVTTLPATTVSNQFHLVEHPDRPNTAIDHLLHSIVRSAVPELVTRTLLTTFTLLTTVLENDSTVVSSREKTISNVVTQKLRSTLEYTPSQKADPSTTIAPELLGSLDSSFVTNTLTTFYTYYNTFGGEAEPVVLTSLEKVENVVTLPAYLRSLTPGADQFYFEPSHVFETETYFSTYTFSKTIYDETSSSQVHTTLETLTQVVVTEEIMPMTLRTPTTQMLTPTFIPPQTPSELKKTYYTTFTTFLTNLEGTNFVTTTTSHVTSNVVVITRTPTLVSPEFMIPSTPTFMLPSTDAYELYPMKLHKKPVMIYATKTYYTTTTYLTSILGAGNQTKIHSRTQVVSNIVTEAMSTALNAEYLNALKSSYLAEHSTLLEFTSSIEEMIPTRTIEGTYYPEPSMFNRFPHWPKDEDQAILDREMLGSQPPKIIRPTIIKNQQHFDEMKSEIHHIVNQLASSKISPTKSAQPLYSTITVDNLPDDTEASTLQSLIFDEEPTTVASSADFDFDTERPISHIRTPPLKSSSTQITFFEDYESTTPENGNEEIVQSVYINNKLVAKPVTRVSSSTMHHNQPVAHEWPSKIKPVEQDLPTKSKMKTKTKDKASLEMIKSKNTNVALPGDMPISEAGSQQQIFDLISDLTGEVVEAPDYYDEAKEEDAFKEHEEGSLSTKIYDLSTDAKNTSSKNTIPMPHPRNTTSTEFGFLEPFSVLLKPQAEVIPHSGEEDIPATTAAAAEDIPAESPPPTSSERVTVIKFGPNGSPNQTEVMISKAPTSPPAEATTNRNQLPFTVTTKRPKVTKPAPPEIPDEYEDSSEASTKIYNLFVKKPASSNSAENTSGDLDDELPANQNDDKSEEESKEHSVRRPPGIFSSSGSTGPSGGHGPSKTSLVIPASGSSTNEATPQVISTHTGSGINWKPLLNLGAIGLGGLGASTLTKLTPLLSSMAGYLKSGFVPGIARNDTQQSHNFKNERPYGLRYPQPDSNYMHNEPNYIPIGSMNHNPNFRPPEDAIPRHPVISHANEPNFRPIPNNPPKQNGKPGSHRFENGPERPFPPPSYNFKPPNDKHSNVFTQMAGNPHNNNNVQQPSSNIVKVVAGNPINAMPVNRAPDMRPQLVKKEILPNQQGHGHDNRRPPLIHHRPEQSQENPGLWPNQIILPFPSELDLDSEEHVPVRQNSKHRPDHPVMMGTAEIRPVNRPGPPQVPRPPLPGQNQQHHPATVVREPQRPHPPNRFQTQHERPVNTEQIPDSVHHPSEEVPTRFINHNQQPPQMNQLFTGMTKPGGPDNPFNSQQLRPLQQYRPHPPPQSHSPAHPFIRDSSEEESRPINFIPPQPIPPNLQNSNQFNFRPTLPPRVGPMINNIRPENFQEHFLLDLSSEELQPRPNHPNFQPRPAPGSQQAASHEIPSEEILLHPHQNPMLFQRRPQQPNNQQQQRPPFVHNPEHNQGSFRPMNKPGQSQPHPPQLLSPTNNNNNHQGPSHPLLGPGFNIEIEGPLNNIHLPFRPQGGLYEIIPSQSIHHSEEEMRPGPESKLPEIIRHPEPEIRRPELQERPGLEIHRPGFEIRRPELQDRPGIEIHRPVHEFQPERQQRPGLEIRRPEIHVRPEPQSHRPELRPWPEPEIRRPEFQNHQQPEVHEPEREQESHGPQFQNEIHKPPVHLPGMNLPNPNQGPVQLRPPILMPGSQELHWNSNKGPQPISNEENSDEEQQEAHGSHYNSHEGPGSHFQNGPRPLPPMYKPTPPQSPYLERPSTVYFVHETYDPVPSDPPTTTTTTTEPPVTSSKKYPQLIIKEIPITSKTTSKPTTVKFVPRPNFIRRSTTVRPTTTTTPKPKAPETSSQHYFGLYPQGFEISPTIGDIFGISKAPTQGAMTEKTLSNEILDDKEKHISKFGSSSVRPNEILYDGDEEVSFGQTFSGSEDSEAIIDPVKNLVIKSPFDHANSSTTENIRTSAGPNSDEQDTLLNAFKVPDSFFSGSTPKDFEFWWPTTFKPVPGAPVASSEVAVTPKDKNFVQATTFRNTVKPTTFRPRRPLLSSAASNTRDQLTEPTQSVNSFYDEDEGLENVKLKNIEIHKMPNFQRRPGPNQNQPPKPNTHPVFALIPNSFEDDEGPEDSPVPPPPTPAKPEPPKPPTKEFMANRTIPQQRPTLPSRPPPPTNEHNQDSKEYIDDIDETNETYEVAPPGYPVTRLRPPPPPPRSQFSAVRNEDQTRLRPFNRQPPPSPPDFSNRPGPIETLKNIFRRPNAPDRRPEPPGHRGPPAQSQGSPIRQNQNQPSPMMQRPNTKNFQNQGHFRQPPPNVPPPNQRFPFRPDFTDSFNKVKPIPLNPAAEIGPPPQPPTTPKSKVHPDLVRRPSTSSPAPPPVDPDLSYEDEDELPAENDIIEPNKKPASGNGLSLSTPIIPTEKKPTPPVKETNTNVKDLTPAAAGDDPYYEEGEDEFSEEQPEVKPQPVASLTRPNHIGGHLVNNFRPQQQRPSQRPPITNQQRPAVMNPLRPLRPLLSVPPNKDSSESSKEAVGSREFSRPNQSPPRTEMEPPPIDSHRLKPSVLELPSNGPIRYRPGRPQDGGFRPNLLRPDDQVMKPEPIRPSSPSFHTIASVDEDNKIIGTNLIPAVIPSRSTSTSASTTTTTTKPLIKPSSASVDPSRNIEPTREPVIIGSVEPVSLEMEDASEEETPILAGSMESSVVKYVGGTLKTESFSEKEATTRSTFSRSVTRTFQRSSTSTTSKPVVVPTKVNLVIKPTKPSELPSVQNTFSRSTPPPRRPFGRPTLGPGALNPESSPTPRPDARKPFIPIRNPNPSSPPPWHRRTTTGKPVSQIKFSTDGTTSSTTARPQTRYTFTTERTSTTLRFSPAIRTRGTTTPTPTRSTTTESPNLVTDESQHLPVSPLSSPATVDTTVIGSESNDNSVYSPTTFRPANHPTMFKETDNSTETSRIVTSSLPPKISTEPNSIESKGSEEFEISENPTILFTKNGTISVNKTPEIVPTRVSQRGGTRRSQTVVVSTASNISTRLPTSSPTLSTRYVTHTETSTETIRETETTVVSESVGAEPMTHTVVITKTMPPQTLISTIVGTVTLVNTVEITPTTVRSTIFSEPTKAIFAVTEQTTITEASSEPDDKVLHAGVHNSRIRPVTRRPITESTTGRDRETADKKSSDKKPRPNLFDPACNCSLQGNQMCRTIGNSTVSKCACKPGYARIKPNAPCRPTFTYEMSMAVNNMEGMAFNFNDLKNEATDAYSNFAGVTKEALDKAFLSTDIKRQFQGAEVMKVKPEMIKNEKLSSLDPRINVDFLVQLTVNMTEDRIKNHLIRTLKASNFSVGKMGVMSSRNISDYAARDFDECSNPDFHDCSVNANCINVRGSYSCQCRAGFKDRSKRHKPGRDCTEMAGCAECNYRGNCYLDKYGNSSCDCFRWYGGAECQINLKVLLMTIIGVGAILFFLVLLCGILICRRNKRARERPGSGRFMRYRSPTSQATLERTAIMHDSGSSSSEGSQSPPTRSNNHHPSFTPDSLQVDSPDKNGRGGNDNVNLMNFSLRNVVMDQDRSLTVVIPRAKIRPSSRPSSRPGPGASGGVPLGHDANADLATTERKLINYLDHGAYPIPTHKPSGPTASTSQTTLQRNNEAKAFRKLSLQERRISTGALVSSGTEVSARGGMRRRSTGLEPELPIRGYEKTLSDMRSYDETTVRSHAKQMFASETSRASCYSCKPPSYCAYSESAGHTMAEKDGASTVYTTQGKLFRMSNDSDSNLSSD